MKESSFLERVSAMIPRYEQLFAERSDVTPSDPLEFHLYHLARYWSRLVAFCRLDPSSTEARINSDLGACVAVGSEFTHKMIGQESPIYQQWQGCWKQTQAVLYERPVSIDDVEAASTAFKDCLAVLKYDPWA
jgi:hypothetical protein